MLFAMRSLWWRLLLVFIGFFFPVATNAASEGVAFSFDQLREEARRLASAPYVPPSEEVGEYWRNLSYDQHREIEFREASGLWRQESPFSLEFFHVGWLARELVDLFEVKDNVALRIPFIKERFDYGNLLSSPEIRLPNRYAGWRAKTFLNSKDREEFLVFLGASYFRAIPAHSRYGVSARALSINSGLKDVPEEFPSFSRFYIEKPEGNSKSLVTNALLNGPSVAGAYRFTTTPGMTTIMDVEAEITLRQPVQQLGLTPFSSMFWFGEGTDPKPYDFRPEVHDSDALLIATGEGGYLLRPLEVTKDETRHCVFSLKSPRSWSLLQRDRAFASYKDPEARYHQRPSVTVEPLEGFEDGRVHLIELPTTAETDDNIVTTWEPAIPPQVGVPFRFRYRLLWRAEIPRCHLFQVRSTSSGHPVERPNQILMVLEFEKGPSQPSRPDDPVWIRPKEVEPVVTLSRDDAKLIYAGVVDLTGSYGEDLPSDIEPRDGDRMNRILRVFFVFEPAEGTDEIDMSCELRDPGGRYISEKWLYLWRPARGH